MINVELNYNPYLKETNIKFNGHAPRVNSLVEKYLKETLQSWVDKIPEIFYDEMNGYGFELEFTGTTLDCEYVKNAFQSANVSEDSVKIFHKNELDSRKVKLERIQSLYSWFKHHNSRKFDYEHFVKENGNVMEPNFTCVLLNMETEVLFNDYPVSFESIDEISELENTDLKNTPIVFYINEQSIKSLKRNLSYLLARKDVMNAQIFFVVDECLKTVNIERTIRDYGVECPQVICSVKDEKLKRYLDIYPVTDYINTVIHILRKSEADISEILEKENQESVITNKEVHLQIEQLEEGIRNLKTSVEFFVNRDNLEDVPQLHAEKLYLRSHILDWKNKKTKITKEQEAILMSKEFVSEIQNYYQNFISGILENVDRVKQKIEDDYRTWYRFGRIELDFTPDIVFPEKTNEHPINISADEFLKLKDEKYVTAKEDILGKLFKSSNEKDIELVLETTYYYQKWREYALDIVMLIADEMIQEKNSTLKEYARSIAEQYLLQLKRIITEQTDIKESVANQLSEDELKLQLDNDWFVEFQEQLRKIERG